MSSDQYINVMPIDVLIDKASVICKQCGVKKLDLFGSFATGDATPRSDIDFVVYGKVNSDLLEMRINEIETLRKIDIIYYDEVKNTYLLEDIKKYGRKIY